MLDAIEFRIDALGEHVHRQRDEADIAGALAIAEERAFDAVSARQHGELGGRHRRAPVIVGMQRNDDAVAVLDIAAEPFDLVGMDIGRRHFDRVGEIEDELLRGVGS